MVKNQPLPVAPLNPIQYARIVEAALAEDLGRAGDLTTDSVVDADIRAETVIAARSAGRVAGLDVALRAFTALSDSLVVSIDRGDGSDVAAGAILARIEGPARPLLSAERTALNFLGRLCGIATATRDIVALVADFGAKIVCTRKTTPGLRVLEKYAVRVGGGLNHRFGLDDAILIKDNHIAAAGGLQRAVERVQARLSHLVKVQVEVDTLAQLEALLTLRVDAVLLDNMSVEDMTRAVQLVDRRMIVEASGGITAESARAIAETGVDVISVGWLTHSAASLNVGLDFLEHSPGD